LKHIFITAGFVCARGRHYRDSYSLNDLSKQHAGHQDYSEMGDEAWRYKNSHKPAEASGVRDVTKGEQYAHAAKSKNQPETIPMEGCDLVLQAVD